jgi:FixJ family two-component response regulator
MTGLELQKALALSPNPLPLLFLTGDGDISSRMQAMRCGAEDFLAKLAPIEPLAETVERALLRDARERRQRRDVAPWNTIE